MHSMLFSVLLVLGAGSEASAAQKNQPLADGSLIFLENCDSVVELTTRGKIGHVALLLSDGGTPWVYEATPAKVRRVTLEAYYAELAGLNKRRDDDNLIRIFALRPKNAYQPDEITRMRTYLDSQLGRRYSVKNYVRGKPYDGIHCAELAANTLNQSGRYAFENCHKIHPQALYVALLPTHAVPQEILLTPPTIKESWCLRAQRRSAEWFTWCGWSCREAWSFCW
jgi:hypothetical protein